MYRKEGSACQFDYFILGSGENNDRGGLVLMLDMTPTSTHAFVGDVRSREKCG